MPDVREQEAPARKLLPIIYVIDTSGSMIGDRIASVNLAMNETINVLREVSNDNPTAELKIGVLKFSSGAKWITDAGFVYVDDFYWNDLTAGGLTDYGSALTELNNKLSRSEFLDSEVGYKAPAIIFMSDGEPTDDYESAIKKIEDTNRWYRVATKIAIAIGDDPNIAVLQKITGNNEAVIRVDDLTELKELIRVVSVSASQIGSMSRTSSDITSEVMQRVKEELVDDGQSSTTILIPDANSSSFSAAATSNANDAASSDDGVSDWGDVDWD